MLANLLKTLGLATANVESQGCFLLFIDEPECPKSLVK